MLVTYRTVTSSNESWIVQGTPVRRTDPSAVPASDPEPSQPASDPEPSQPASDPEPSQPSTDLEPADPPTPPAPSTINRRGLIQVNSASDGKFMGYISTPASGYLSFGSSTSDALHVNFDTDLTGIGTNININIEVRLNLV